MSRNGTRAMLVALWTSLVAMILPGGICHAEMVPAEPPTVAGPGASWSPGDPAPAATIDKLHAALLKVMKEAATLDFDARSAALGPAVVEAYDVEFMAMKALGPHAKTLAGEDRRRWIDTFARYTIANYARRFDGYSGQSFETLDVQSAPQDTVRVRSRVVRPGKSNVDIDYRLHQRDGAWRIVDVYAMGTISELATRRAEFSSFLESKSLAALIEDLGQRASRGRE